MATQERLEEARKRLLEIRQRAVAPTDDIGITEFSKEERLGQARRRLLEIRGQKIEEPERPGVFGESRLGRGLAKFGEISGKVLATPSKFLFGTAAETIPAVIGAGVESGKELITGEPAGRAFRERAEDIGAVDIAFTALELLPGGGLLTQFIKKSKAGERLAIGVNELIQKIPPQLKESAVKQFSQALGATKIEFKRTVAKIIPELLKRKITSFTRKGLQKNAIDNLKIAGEGIERELARIPEGQVIKIKPIISDLEKAKDSYTIIEKGEKFIVEPEPVKRIEELQSIISDFGDKISFGSLRKLRQIWDETIDKSKGFSKFSRETTTAIDAKKSAANSIRNELAKANPDLAKVNVEFTFWKRLEGVVSETIERTSSQQLALSQRIAQSIGAGAGFMQGGVMQAVIGATIMKNLVKLTTSTGWRTISAVQKNRLANFIAEGKATQAGFLITKLLTGIGELRREEK